MTRLGPRKGISILAGLAATLAVALAGLPATATAPTPTTSAAKAADDMAPASIVQSVAVPGGPCGDPVLGTTCRAYFPDLTRDPHGDADDLLMVYRWSSAHSQQPSQLRMMRSRDGGATWQQATPFIVADFEDYDYRDPSITTLSSGRVLLSYFVADGQTGAFVQTQVKRRDADNAAFSAPVQVFSSTMPRPINSAKIAELDNGQLLIPLYGTPNGSSTHASIVVASVDGGVTWDGRVTGRQKTIASSPAVNYQEPAITEIEPGHVRAIIRTASTSGASTAGVQTDSYDNTYMTTWTAPTSLGVAMHGPEVEFIPGTNLVPTLWSQPNASTSPTNRPTVIALRRTNVLWADTPKHMLYNPGSNWDSGYPGTAAIGTTRLVTVVYDTDRNAAIALRYNTTDVD
ncbi:exo-alpha-sialidase [Jiangella ureilytica]|uniref:Exo-alpha-sialidase n=1 Tax=Jiangella ureilytica TaxID=2530374 RepID=A0A4R4RH81_9ACTN|nr:sialidase family protein [Jiangella ureilytica]TDC48616.1 exo-alpha-sialidase [Jiangella ureilytica]